MPVTMPDAEPTVATPPVMLHVPPGVASLRVVVVPTHAEVVPVIDAGRGLTVTYVTELHPVDNI